MRSTGKKWTRGEWFQAHGNYKGWSKQRALQKRAGEKWLDDTIKIPKEREQLRQELNPALKYYFQQLGIQLVQG